MEIDAAVKIARWRNSPEQMRENKMDDELSPSEAIFGFAAWLTCRKEVTNFGADHNCAGIPELITEFCEVNGFAEAREGWHNRLIHPPAES